MYGQPMSIASQIADDGDDVINAAGGGSDSADNQSHNHHIAYDPHALDDAAAAGDEVNHDAVYASAAAAVSGCHDLAVHRAEGSSQLTLSFRGQVYVFDAVTPDKVQAVLLLLGGCEISGAAQGVGLPNQNRAVVDIPSRCNQPQRAASLHRFRQKRKERCFDKKVRYEVRQEVALRMQRNKGQFTSKKSEGGCGWGDAQESGQDDNPPETLCTHCGTSSKSTPMMRRGPSGPRSLCNACGLFWANKGTLRDVSKKIQDHSAAPVEQGEGEASDSNCETTIRSHNNLANFTNGDGSALMSEQ